MNALYEWYRSLKGPGARPSRDLHPARGAGHGGEAAHVGAVGGGSSNGSQGYVRHFADGGVVESSLLAA